MKAMIWAAGMVLTAVLATGCSTPQQNITADSEYTPPTSIYNILDSTALVYSDPAAGAAINDHPLRWLGFLLHPVGHALDYGVNRPAYTLGGSFPYLFGYTAEDAMVNAQRR
ncbi:MAG: hypothetical protein U0412_00950 [Nitrospira sp.]